MKLVLNGSDRDIADVSTMSELLDHLGLSGARVVIERNGELVKKETFAATALREHDRIEIVRLVGGG